MRDWFTWSIFLWYVRARINSNKNLSASYTIWVWQSINVFPILLWLIPGAAFSLRVKREWEVIVLRKNLCLSLGAPPWHLSNKPFMIMNEEIKSSKNLDTRESTLAHGIECSIKYLFFQVIVDLRVKRNNLTLKESRFDIYIFSLKWLFIIYKYNSFYFSLFIRPSPSSILAFLKSFNQKNNH